MDGAAMLEGGTYPTVKPPEVFISSKHRHAAILNLKLARD
jgi:hypothetical protein